MVPEDDRAARWARWWPAFGGPLLTLLVVLVTEIVLHGFGIMGALSAGLLLLGLVTTAYGALQGGMRTGIVSAVILALFTLHYSSPHERLVAMEPSIWVGGGIVLALGIAMTWPMSRIKAREAQLRAALRLRAEDAEARNRELVEANAALEAFGYVVSHDLKEPVRALENYLDAAREAWPSDESREYLDEAYQSNRRLAQLLHGLLEYSRTSTLITNPRPMPVKDVILGESCRSMYERRIAERGARLELDQDLGRAVADDLVLAQIFGNAILNAVRHNPRDTPQVRVRRMPGNEDTVHVVVEDNGPGFPPDVIDRFDALGLARPATIKGGFGLIIAHRAAQRLGGRIWLENMPGGAGGRIHVEMPAAPPVPDEAPAARAGLAQLRPRP